MKDLENLKYSNQDLIIYIMCVLLIRLANIKHNIAFQYKLNSFCFFYKNILIFRILGTNKNFMIGPWLESAKALATTEQEKANYEYNAR